MSTSDEPVPLGVIQGRPTTFAERGVCIPFTAPILAQARIRTDRLGQLECLLPGFSGGRGTYVFSWKTVPEVVKVTLHDRVLHKEIQESNASSPDTVRQAALEIAARGFAGLAAAAQAKSALTRDRQYTILTNYVFVLELLGLVGIRAPDLLRDGLNTQETRNLARSALVRVAETFRIAPDTLFARVEDLSNRIAPVGLPQAPRAGRLRDLVDRLAWLRDDVTDWAEMESSEAAGLARYMARCAEQTLTLARERLDRLDPILRQVKELVTGSDRYVTDLLVDVGRLSWLLDGWDYICQLWEDSRFQSEDMQRIAMCEVFRIAPQVPMEETTASNENDETEDLRKVQRRWVRLGQDWRTGALDYDRVRQVEQTRAKLV